MTEITITIKPQGSEESFSVTITQESTVLQLKEACVGKCSLALEDIRLIFKGKILKDEMTLAEYKIENGVTVNLV